MSNRQQILHDVFRTGRKAVKALGAFLSFSLADHRFSFAKVVCISLEADGIYLVYGEKALWRISIKHCRYVPPEEDVPPSPEYLASVVSDFVSEWKLFRASFILCLPRAWTILKKIDLPLIAAENLAGVISFELDRFTPLSKDNAFYDYTVLGEDSSHLKIGLAVARADQISAYQKALQNKKIRMNKAIISSHAIRSLILKTSPKADAIYLLLRGDVYEYGIIENSLLMRSVSGRLKTGDEEAFRDLAGQVLALGDELTRLGRRPQILVDADEMQIQKLRNHLGTAKVSGLHFDGWPNDAGDKKNLSFVALGGALGELYHISHNINLLNGDHHLRPRVPFLLTILLSATIAGMVAFHFLVPLSYEQQKLDEMDRHIRKLKPAIKKVEALKSDLATLHADIQAMDSFKKKNDLTMNIIKDMTTILPPKTWLTRMKITDKTVDIEGYSPSATDIILKLESSKYFQKAEFASPTFRDPRQNSDRFVIKMELKNEYNQPAPKSEMKNDRKK